HTTLYRLTITIFILKRIKLRIPKQFIYSTINRPFLIFNIPFFFSSLIFFYKLKAISPNNFRIITIKGIINIFKSIYFRIKINSIRIIKSTHNFINIYIIIINSQYNLTIIITFFNFTIIYITYPILHIIPSLTLSNYYLTIELSVYINESTKTHLLEHCSSLQPSPLTLSPGSPLGSPSVECNGRRLEGQTNLKQKY